MSLVEATFRERRRRVTTRRTDGNTEKSRGRGLTGTSGDDEGDAMFMDRGCPGAALEGHHHDEQDAHDPEGQDSAGALHEPGHRNAGMVLRLLLP
jgi:hypothetical protein